MFRQRVDSVPAMPMVAASVPAVPAPAGADAPCSFPAPIPWQRAIQAVLLLCACVNVTFSALAGYINPRDYVQDVVAAHQFLKHATMYPADLQQMGIVELSAPIMGREQLRRLPVVRHDLDRRAPAWPLSTARPESWRLWAN